MHPFVSRVSRLTHGALPKNPPDHKPLFDDCPVCQALDVGTLQIDEDLSDPDEPDTADIRREYEKEYWKHPRIRRCPDCEKSAWEDDAPSECPRHGSPFEGPFEYEEEFFRLLGHDPAL